MKRVAATSAYVRSWLPSVWKRALQRLLHFLLRLSMFPRRLLMLEGSGAAAATASLPASDRRRWLRVTAPDEAPAASSADEQDGVRDAGDEDAVFFAAADDAVHAAASTRRGLSNTGNTCFVNAVVQCLLAIPGFVERLEDEVMRVVARYEDEERADTTSDTREKRRHETQLKLAQTLVDLLKGLMPEETERDEQTASEENGSSNLNGSAHRNGKSRKDGVHGDAEEIAKNELTRKVSGKKRKRPMSVHPGDYSASATTKRLKCFLQAASKCSDLVSTEARRQDQQDAEELLLFLLDSLHELLKHVLPSPPERNNPKEVIDVDDESAHKTANLIELNRLVKLENECLQNLKKCVVTDPGTYNTTVAFLGDVRWHRYLKENSSFITDMFTGQIVRGSQCCSCANLTCLHQEFRVLSLSVDSSQASQTLEHCLETHRGLEDLVADNKVFCDGHCQDKTSRRTQVLLQRVPPALVIQLQRFKQTGWQTSAEKIGCSVEFPIDEPLDLTVNMFLRDPTQPVQYKLQAVCAHLGSSLNAGHYIAYARDTTERDGEDTSSSDTSQPRASDRWNKFDDDFVTTLDAATLRTETQNTAYMLFYTLVSPVGQDAEVEPLVQNQEQSELESTLVEEDDDDL